MTARLTLVCTLFEEIDGLVTAPETETEATLPREALPLTELVLDIC